MISLSAGSALFTALTIDAWGRIEQKQYGNGVKGTASFDGPTGRTSALAAASPGSGTSNVVNLGYVWDSLSNLKQRTDGNGDGTPGASVTETMAYDTVNRLTSYTVAGEAGAVGANRQATYQYNALGELLYRSDLGVYVYPTQGASSQWPHAVKSVGSTLATHDIAYKYDLQGNLVSASGTGSLYSAISYTSFNLPDAVNGVTGTDGSTFTWRYDENHARIKETRTGNAVSVTAVGPSGTSSSLGGGGIAPGVVAAGTRVTWYLQPDNAGGLSFEYEQTTPASGTATNLSRHYLNVGGVAIGMLEATGGLPAPSGTAPATIASITLVKVEYWHKDSLGSLVATTDQTGAVTDRYAYDPFGKRRFTTGAYDGTGALVGDYTTGTSSGTARGFTGHEHIDEIGLIHMNGRLFDATSGRFMQADPMIGDPQDLGAYNRYAYCGNNPMGCVDPTGYCFLGCFWHASHLVADWHQLWGNQVIRSIAIAVAAYYTGSAAASVFESSEAGTVGADGYAAAATTYAAGGSPAAAEAAAIAAEDATTSSIAAESALVNEAVGGLTAGLLGSNGNLKAGLEGAAFGMANGYIGDTWNAGKNLARNVAAHLVLGCVQAVAGHSKCGGGALSAGFTALFESQYERNVYGGIEASIVGGTASVIGGGKFVNGAEVAAFMYLYNHLLHIYGEQRDDSANVFGHSATAISGMGVYSFGNDTPLGSSVTDYVSSQSLVRDQIIVFVPTSPEEGEAVQGYVSQSSSSRLSGNEFENLITNNCAAYSINIMGAAHLLGPTQFDYMSQMGVPFLPSTASILAASLPGAIAISLPLGASISPVLNSLLQSFNPKSN